MEFQNIYDPSAKTVREALIKYANFGGKDSNPNICFKLLLLAWHFILAYKGTWLSVRKYVARIMTAIIFDTEMGKHYVCC